MARGKALAGPKGKALHHRAHLFKACFLRNKECLLNKEYHRSHHLPRGLVPVPRRQGPRHSPRLVTGPPARQARQRVVSRRAPTAARREATGCH